METIPPGLLNSVSTVGLVILLGWALAAGWLITRREANAMRREIDAQRAALATKDKTISDFKDAMATNNALVRAVLDVAREQQHRIERGDS